MYAPNPARALNGVEEATLAIGVDAHVGEVGVQNTKQREHDSQCAGKPRYSCVQLGDSEVKCCDRLVQAGCRCDRRERPSKPARRCRTRDAYPRGDGGVARVLDEAQQSMVVASLGSLGGHRSIVLVIPPRTLIRRGDDTGCAGNSNKNAGRS